MRRFTHADHVLLADTTPDGRARLDALARWLQDAAYLDVADAGLGEHGAWIVRRTRLEVERFPRLGERVALTTWCSGLGKMWAERRTTISGAVQATALWVHVDPATGRPRPLDTEQLEVWGPSAGGRTVRARLTHRNPPEGTDDRRWRFRAADLDVAGHVNNAAYWTVVEEDLRRLAGPVVAEVEHRGAAAAGDVLVRRDVDRWWVCSPEGQVHASFVVGTRTVDP